MLAWGRRHQSTLIVGTSAESSLIATLLGAVSSRSSILDSDVSVARVPSLDDIEDELSRQQWQHVIVDEAQDYSHAQSVFQNASISTARDELERHFGRVSVGTTSDTFEAAPVSQSWLVTQRIMGAFALIPAAFCVLIFWVAFTACGVRKVIRRETYVGQYEQPIQISVIAPVIPVSITGRRAIVAASLERQVRRLHLVHALGFINVLRGNVAVVGPSLMTVPEFQRRCEELPTMHWRTLVRPGLVSLARTRIGSAQARYDQKRELEYDLYYMKYRTPLLNLRVIARATFVLVRDLFKTLIRVITTGTRLLVGSISDRWRGVSSSASRFATPAMPVDQESAMTPVLIVGAGSAGAQLIQGLQNQPQLGMWPVAIVDDDWTKLGTRVGGVPVLGTTDSLNVVALREGVEEVIIAIPSASDIDRTRIAELAQTTGKPVHSIPPMSDLLRGVSSTRLSDVQPSDLLGRPVIEIDPAGARELLCGKRVLITGAAGSIGREVVIQALRGEPATIYGLDINESDLYDLEQDLKRSGSQVQFVPIVASITEIQHLRSVVARVKPHVVFHAGAYKHVPLMESYPWEALKTNITGTWNVVTAAAESGAERFVMVSTDKAVRPSSVMGASKRVAELIVREVGAETGLSVCSVRFGNVLGSRGSVIPLFKRQIAAGGPVTVTDEGMTRYFMTIPEAAQLIIEAGALGDRGAVYMLDMGEPVRIVDLAKRIIAMSGLREGVDIQIAYTGLRPGEKLFEELSLDFEEARATRHPKVRILEEPESQRAQSAREIMTRLLDMIESGSPEEIRNEILTLVGIADGTLPQGMSDLKPTNAGGTTYVA